MRKELIVFIMVFILIACEAEEPVMIHFDAQEGSFIASIDQSDYNEHPTPQKDGYIFEGWYLDQDYETAYEHYMRFEEDQTLYAKWTRNYHRIAFYIGNDLMAIKHTENNTLNQLPDPIEKKGYTFVGWFLDHDLAIVPFTENTKVSEDHTLGARYLKDVNLQFEPLEETIFVNKGYDITYTYTESIDESEIEIIAPGNVITITDEHKIYFNAFSPSSIYLFYEGVLYDYLLFSPEKIGISNQSDYDNMLKDFENIKTLYLLNDIDTLVIADGYEIDYRGYDIEELIIE